MKLWLVIMNRTTKLSWFKYFDNENEMDDFIRRIKYVSNLLLIEDSRDTVYF